MNKSIPNKGDKLMVETTYPVLFSRSGKECQGRCNHKYHDKKEIPFPPGEGALDQMRAKSASGEYAGCKWAAYQNHALDSSTVGHVVYFPYGPKNTFKTAADLPPKAPDGSYGAGWKYLHVGFVNLETGEVLGEEQ